MDGRQIGGKTPDWGKTPDYGNEYHPLLRLLISSLILIFCHQILFPWELIMVAQNLKGMKLLTEVHDIGHDKGRFVGTRDITRGEVTCLESRRLF